jgi:hypothetical protein
MPGRNVYLEAMLTKPIELPPEVAKAFVKDMRAFHAEPNAIKQDEIAARQLQALREYASPRQRKLRIHDVREMFEEMRAHLQTTKKAPARPKPRRGRS